MDRAAIIDELNKALVDYLERKGLELVEIICRIEGGDLFLKLLVDWPEGGITLGDCSGLNKEISAMLDEKNILDQRYVLEVSSPGLDRPLKTKKDFLRYKNKTVKIFLNEPINGKLEWDGIVDSADEESVYIKTADKPMRIPLLKINRAKQLF